jgi:hypothetical protein
MDKVINQKGKSHVGDQDTMRASDPYNELDQFFAKEPLLKHECPDVISWFGVSSICFVNRFFTHKMFTY